MVDNSFLLCLSSNYSLAILFSRPPVFHRKYLFILDALFSMYSYLFISLLYMFRATQCSSSGQSNCINTSCLVCRRTGIPGGHLHRVIYRVSQEECARLREGVPYVKVYRYNPKHLCRKSNGYGDNVQRIVWSSGGSTHCTCQLTTLSMSVLECGFILRQISSCSL